MTRLIILLAEDGTEWCLQQMLAMTEPVYVLQHCSALVYETKMELGLWYSPQTKECSLSHFELYCTCYNGHQQLFQKHHKSVLGRMLLCCHVARLQKQALLQNYLQSLPFRFTLLRDL